MIEKLKQRWEIESTLQIIIIFIVFSISGSATLFIKQFIFEWINFDKEWPFLLKTTIYILTIVPIYQITLLSIGTLLGQFEFFWQFEKKTLRRFGIKIGRL